MRTLDIVLVGTGRSGTAGIANHLFKMGMKVGHEAFFSHQGLDRALKVLGKHWKGLVGDSSWLAVPYLDTPPLEDALVVHLRRHPQKVMESWLRRAPETTPEYWKFALEHAPEIGTYNHVIDRYAARYVVWNEMIEEACKERPLLVYRLEDELMSLLTQLAQRLSLDMSKAGIQVNAAYNAHKGAEAHFHPDMIQDESLRARFLEMSRRYGYTWEEPAGAKVKARPDIPAVITTLDNVAVLEEQIRVLADDSWITRIIVVNNGSKDGTKAYLEKLGEEVAGKPLICVHRDNLGAGPGRNAGLDAAGVFDYVLMIDGGIWPLINGTERMLEYMRVHVGVDVLGVEIADCRSDRDKAYRIWSAPVVRVYQNLRLSHTAYALCRASAWTVADGPLRFSEEGPFAKPGWGADDDDMAMRQREAGVTVFVHTCPCRHGESCTHAHPYRHAGGSWGRLKAETGVSPTGYGSTYEERIVKLAQDWPQYEHGMQWGEPWLTLVIRANPSVNALARLIKRAHDGLRKRRFEGKDGRWRHIPNPYSIILWNPTKNEKVSKWAEPRRYRQHHGTRIWLDGEKVKRNEDNESTWAADFRVWEEEDWEGAVRSGSYYYALIETQKDLTRVLSQYTSRHPSQRTKLAVPKEMNVQLGA